MPRRGCGRGSSFRELSHRTDDIASGPQTARELVREIELGVERHRTSRVGNRLRSSLRIAAEDLDEMGSNSELERRSLAAAGEEAIRGRDRLVAPGALDEIRQSSQRASEVLLEIRSAGIRLVAEANHVALDVVGDAIEEPTTLRRGTRVERVLGDPRVEALEADLRTRVGGAIHRIGVGSARGRRARIGQRRFLAGCD